MYNDYNSIMHDIARLGKTGLNTEFQGQFIVLMEAICDRLRGAQRTQAQKELLTKVLSLQAAQTKKELYNFLDTH